MSADNAAYVGRYLYQFVPDGLSPVAGRYLVAFADYALGLCTAFKVAVGQEYNAVVLVFVGCAEVFGPFEHFVARSEFAGDDEQFAPVLVGELEGGVFERLVAVAVGIKCHKRVVPLVVALHGEVFGKTGAAVFRAAVAVVVVSRRDDVGNFVVQALKRARNRFPHLARRLVGHAAHGHGVVVRLYKVARNEHCLYLEIFYVVGRPGCGEFEDRLVDVVFYIRLRVAHEYHRERFGVFEAESFGAFLRGSLNCCQQGAGGEE